MRPARVLLLGLIAACASARPTPHALVAPEPAAAAATREPTPPVAQRTPHPTQLHGRTLTDDYFWLRKKDTPEVLRYLAAENAYTAAMTKQSEPLEAALYKEMLGRVVQTDVSVPHRDHGYFYYQRTIENEQYPIFCRKSAAGVAREDLVGATAKAPEEVLFDPNVLGKTTKFVGVGELSPSDDNATLAYSVDTTGFRQYDLQFKDLRGHASYAEKIPRVDSVAWAKDGHTVFYVVEDATTKRPYRLYRHRLGSDPASDALVYEEPDPMFDLGVERTRSRGYLVASSESKTTSEARVLAADHPEGAWRVVEPRQHEHRYYVDHRGRSFYIRTDSPATPGAPRALNFRLVSAPVATPDRAHWKELVPHRADVMLEGVELFDHEVLLFERADALPRLRVLYDGGAEANVPMPEALYAVFPSGAEFDSPALRFNYQSLVTPQTVYDFDWKTHALTLRKREPVTGYDPSAYEEVRLHATASDGTQIPISLVHGKGVVADAAHPQPLLLTGYGSYGFPSSLIFSSPRVSLYERGVVFAIAHIRGGGDLGKPWHEGGRMATKMNTFTDFIACAEALEKLGWTTRDRLVITGGSAGGLLMGAVTNLRPELWKAVVARVPFVDVLNTMLDESLPLTTGEFEEWGNPKLRADFEVMARYSPYDNIEKQPYPAMLVMSSYNDSQVMYWEPSKYVARLRANKTDHNPLLFKINMEPAGHGGQSGRYDHLHEEAFVYAFMLRELGIGR